MIDIAARATNGVIIPGMHSTREEIMKLFHEQMDKLRTRLHVSSTSFYLCSGPRQIILQSDAVTGKIHVTCDAWQAGNTDGYFVVTGHWLEETSPGVWVLQEAILGFTRLNNAHHGVRLGQALFKIIKRLNLEDRVSLFFPFRDGYFVAEFSF
jgi:hypothetical protein